MLEKIISGGQTGADQGALDGAIACGVPYGGSIPGGRKTEAGILPLSYQMKELDSSRYTDRTERNVIDADGTLILSHGRLTGGSALTERIAADLQKPCLHIDFNQFDTSQAAGEVTAWIMKSDIRILNVAGPRASSDPHIYDLTRKLIALLLETAAG
ncbi:MAG: putative molybdenum carrier protein [Desulfocapsaceae bacterium]